MFPRKLRKRTVFLLASLVVLIVGSGIMAIALNNGLEQRGPHSSIKNLGVGATGYPKTPGHATIDSTYNIHSFLTFDYNITDTGSIASRYDFVWGVTDSSTIASYKAANPNIFLTYYMPFHRDHGPFMNIDAYGSLQQWQKNHPDWILYKCDRVTPAYEYGDPYMPLDFSLPSVVTWQIGRYALPAMNAGYDGIAADNVDFGNWYGACGTYKNGRWVQRYTGQADDPQWRADILTWMSRMQTALHALARPLKLVPNLAFGGLAPTDPQVLQLLSYSDAIVDEGGFTNYGSGYTTGAAWLQTLQLMSLAQQQGKSYYSINQYGTVTRSGIQWALASYLMGKGSAAAVYICDEQAYGSSVWYSEYNAAIGKPSGAVYSNQSVYWRAYSNGMVLVNPSATSSYTVNLGRTYKNLYGTLVGPALTLAPHTGIVLLLA